MPLAVAEPADPRGKALEGDVLLREADPAGQSGIVRKQLEHARVRLEDVLRIAREGRPAEWPLARREEWPDVGGHESWIGEGLREAALPGLRAQVVAVVEGHGAATLELDHGR